MFGCNFSFLEERQQRRSVRNICVYIIIDFDPPSLSLNGKHFEYQFQYKYYGFVISNLKISNFGHNFNILALSSVHIFYSRDYI